MKLDKRIENLNVYSEEEIVTPAELKDKFPLSERAVSVVMNGQKTIGRILSGEDRRKLIIVGPCSIHNPSEALDYAEKLKKLSEEVKEKLFLVMRVYFEKPRTTVGWQGLVNDPYLDNSCIIDDGLAIARELLLHIAEIGLPAAGEALDLITPQYVQDLFSWTAIGARTTESQTHRKMASGFSSAVGFKNGTTGNINVAINAIKSAGHPNNFISINPEGHSAIVRTKGNRNTHIVLRGGAGKINYDKVSIERCEKMLKSAGLPEKIMIDCSHENSGKDPENQKEVIEDIKAQIQGGNKSIFGLMIESNINGGNQEITKDLNNLKYGVSITDSCLSFTDTEKSIKSLFDGLR
ncbi:MAG: 3-deoxy-7-phosphoheptulonate synthase [Spirochaetaceae bacterium]|nr:3-deoxy-7-phosphoheptulonate synthase [Spirochaetaceae bacterium]